MTKSDEYACIWMGVLLRVSGESFAFNPNRILAVDGVFIQVSFGREELCRPSDVSIVLDEVATWPKGNPEKSLANAAKHSLERAATTLLQIPRELFQQWRSEDRKIDILVATHTPSQVVRLSFPEEFMKICTNLQTPIELYMDHDIPMQRPRKNDTKIPKQS
jgi:hypothetical protein